MDKITYCNECGNELSPVDRFCNICGAPVGISDDINLENPTNELSSDNYTSFNQKINEGYAPAYQKVDEVNTAFYQEINEGNASFYQEINEGNASVYQKINEGNAPFYQELDEVKSPRKKHTGLIVGISVLVCFLAAGLGIWFFISHKGKDDGEKGVKTVEVVFDLQILVKDDVDLSDVKITAEKDDEVVDLEITGNKAVAQLAPGKWKIKAEIPNYEPIIQEVEIFEEASQNYSEAQELSISFDFTEQPVVQSAASDTSGEVTTEAETTNAAADESWRQAYIDYLRDNNILNIYTIPTEMDYTSAIGSDNNGINGDIIDKIYMISMKLYDKDGDGIPELYYLWSFYTFVDDGSQEFDDKSHINVGINAALTCYSYDGLVEVMIHPKS